MDCEFLGIERRRAWRAASILITAHLVPAVLVTGIWLLGLWSIFDDLRLIPQVVSVVVAVVCVLGLFVRFGFWGTARTFGVGYGENLSETFSSRWIRSRLAALVRTDRRCVPGSDPDAFTVMNVRWWHIVGTLELDELPARAATIPIPDDWQLVDTVATRTGVRGFMDGPTGSIPQGYVRMTYKVPVSRERLAATSQLRR
ncbi:MAG: hypothetical protein R2735_00055 [Microthrixaceae bacterium]